MIALDITTERYGRLVAIYATDERRYGGVVWVCQCDCGNTTKQVPRDLRSGNTKSCGCFGSENRVVSNTTHGKSSLAVYKVWQGMHDRCKNPKNKRYARYGGRGISVCTEWDDFTIFHADMGERPNAKSLDRIDNDLGYFKGNCRWATAIEQGSNTGRTRLVRIGGIVDTVANWKRSLHTHYKKVIQLSELPCS